ncbi:TRAP transporter small permease subunit [Hoeflea alexandrii]|uniref:TRAP transporter small permease protein n=1 Tax=Hoeflea alexandrii TaxID=288436 RepID=A0ABT1CYQ8_9HYPH|nr:TRAP transporter small permease subunit [Hoeflea alexandrii]MCO6411068.1 TRAP transporter small permease subunit [Hoeflea alexandrii]MCY0150942.1 TRAP transporter small permease subunit [Hoeflea alexandrii]
MKTIRSTVGIVEKFVFALCCPLAAVGLLCMVFLLTGSSVGRLLNVNQFADLQDYSSLFFFGFVMLTLAPTLIVDRHVRVDVLRGRMPPKTRAIIEIAGLLFVLVPLCLVMTRMGILATVRSYVAGEPLFDLGSSGLKWLMVSFLPLGFVGLMLAGFARMLRQLLILFDRDEPEQAVPWADA